MSPPDRVELREHIVNGHRLGLGDPPPSRGSAPSSAMERTRTQRDLDRYANMRDIRADDNRHRLAVAGECDLLTRCNPVQKLASVGLSAVPSLYT